MRNIFNIFVSGGKELFFDLIIRWSIIENKSEGSENFHSSEYLNIGIMSSTEHYSIAMVSFLGNNHISVG